MYYNYIGLALLILTVTVIAIVVNSTSVYKKVEKELEIINSNYALLKTKVDDIEKEKYYMVGERSRFNRCIPIYSEYSYIVGFDSAWGSPIFYDYPLKGENKGLKFTLERATELAKDHGEFIEDVRTGKRTMVNEEDV